EGVFGQAPTLVAELSDPVAQETGSFVSADCLRAWFASNRDGTTDIFYAHRANPGDTWILDGKDPDLSTDTFDESDPFVSAEGRRGRPAVDEVEVDHQADLIERHRRHVGVRDRAVQPELLGAGEHEHDLAGDVLAARQIARDRERDRDARRVVVGAGIDRAVD